MIQKLNSFQKSKSNPKAIEYFPSVITNEKHFSCGNQPIVRANPTNPSVQSVFSIAKYGIIYSPLLSSSLRNCACLRSHFIGQKKHKLPRVNAKHLFFNCSFSFFNDVISSLVIISSIVPPLLSFPQ